MAIPRLVQTSVESSFRDYCKHTPRHGRRDARYTFKVRGNSVTLIEERPALLFVSPDKATIDIAIAQFRYDPKTGLWTLYCADRNSRWHVYDECEPTTLLDELLFEVDQDVTGIFFG